MATWDGFSSTNFLASINWVGSILPNENTDAVIDSTGFTQNPTLFEGQTASVFVLQQSARTFTVQGALSVNAGAALSGTGALTITNTGSVAVSGAGLTMTGGALNNFGILNSTLQVSGGAVNNQGEITGAVTVSGGALTLGEFSNLSDSAVLTVNTGGTVIVNAFDVIGGLAGDGGAVETSLGNGLSIIGAANTTFSGVISGEGFLQFDGAGARILSGNNTYSGDTEVMSGVLRIENASALGTTDGGTRVASGAALEVQGNFFLADALTLNGTGVANGGALRNISTDNTWSGAITLGSQTRINSDVGQLTLAGGLTGAFGLTLGGAGTILVDGAGIDTGAGTVTKDGAGVLAFSGSNTYTGTTTVNAGTLLVGGGSALSDTANLIVTAPGSVQVVDSETIGGLAGDGRVALFNNITLTTGGANTSTTFSGVIENFGDPGALTKTGTGTFTLSGANTYKGVTTVSEGVLRIANNAALGTTDGGTSVAANAALEVQGGIDGLTVAEALTLNGTGVSNGGALRNISGENILDGAITLGSQTRINSDSGYLQLLGGVTGADQNLIVGGDGVLLISSAITTGTGSLTKDGAGIVDLYGANTYTGATTVNAGTLELINGTAIADVGAVVVNAPGVLHVFTSEAIGSLAGDGRVALFNEITLTTGGANTSTTFSGVISDGANSNNLTKTGTGTFTLSGANTYTGTTTVNGGVLDLTGEGQIASTSVIVNTGGTLRTNGGADEGGIIDAAAVTLSGTGNLTLTGSETIGSLTGTGGSVTLGANTLTTGNALNTNYAGSITGTGGLTKVGTGTMALTGAISHSGTTTVSAGRLNIETFGTTRDIGDLVVNTGGTLGLDNASLSVDSLTGTGGTIAMTTTNGAVALAFGSDNSSGSFAGGITGDTALTDLIKEGTGTTTLSGANTYQGATTVSAGVLRIASDSALGTTAGRTSVAANAALEVQGGLTVAEALTLNGTGVSDGGALRNISGDNVWDGAITLGSQTRINSDAGQLELNGGVTGVDQNLIMGGAGIVAVFSAITTGTGSLTKDGAGVVALFGANTYTGATTVNAGFLQITNGAAIADTGAVVVNAPSRFEVFQSETIGSLAGGGRVALVDASTLTTGAANTSTTFSGVIENFAGPGNLTKTGTGAFTLSGVNTYEGVTTIAGGALQLAGAGAIASSGNVVIQNNPGTAFDISAISGASASIRDFNFAGPGSVGAIILGGRTLVVTHANGDFGTGTIVGSGAADGLSVTMDAAATSVSLAGLTFSPWTTGVDTITITGNALANSIAGSSRADAINGGGGQDTVDYSASAAGLTVDLLTPSGNTGVAAGDTYVSIENIRGSGLNDTLRGNAGNNIINGGAGTDGMSGRGGDDTYIVDNVGDRVYESTTPTSGIDSGGLDTVFSSVTISLDGYSGIRFVENLTLAAGAGSINGFGNAKDNVLTGNTGNNTLDGGLGNDTMLGGAGNDIYVVDSINDRVFETTTTASLIDATGIDTIQSSVTLSLDAYAGVRFVERLTLTGTGNINGTGNGLGNVLIGNSGNNTLNGSLGADTMGGGAGNDIYVVDSISDRVFETTAINTLIDAGGDDTMLSSVSTSIDAYAAVRFIERLTLTGTDNLVAVGNAKDNVLLGNSGNNTLNGGLGNDTMGGGAGNDIYVVDSINDRVFETVTIASLIDAGGVDTVQSSVTLSLDANAAIRFVERLTLTGTGNIDGVGNALANVMIGNSGNNILDGGLGNDIMGGGAGNDTYVVDSASDFVFETTTISTLLDAGGVDTIVSSLAMNLDATVGLRFVENLTLTGANNLNGTGNALANVLIGNSSNNTLNGGLGADTMGGGAGNDTYFVDDAGDTVFETTTTVSLLDAGGADTIQSSVTMNLNAAAGVRFVENLVMTGAENINGAGNALANVLMGNSGNNTLNGGLGNDTLFGGLGNDTFVFDTALGASNIDVLTGFALTDDIIRLDDAIFIGLAPGATLALSAFVANLTGEAADASDRIIYETDTGALFYDVDGLGGVGRVQFATLTPGLALTNTDFFVF